MRRWPLLIILASAFSFLALDACTETGPDASARQNGCIGSGCFEAGAPDPDASSPVDSSSATDAPVGFGDPLAGSTKTGTLVKGAFQFVEGPVWIGKRLLFSDTNANTIFQLVGTAITPFRTNSNGANGNAVDTQGRLVTCEGNAGKVTRTDAALANPTSVADQFNGKPFNAPNDVVVRADGTIYFTDPFYAPTPDGGLPQNKLAVYRVPAGGAPLRLGFDFKKPNGIALSPDGNTLYVVDNGDGRVLVAELNPDGTTKAGFAKIVDADGGDGMAVDLAGNLYVAAKAGILVFDKAGGPLGTITIAKGTPSNCTFGGADMKTLYITSNDGGGSAATGLYSIALNVPGLP